MTVPNPMLPVDKSDVFEERFFFFFFSAAHHLASPVLGPRGVTDAEVSYVSSRHQSQMLPNGALSAVPTPSDPT